MRKEDHIFSEQTRYIITFCGQFDDHLHVLTLEWPLKSTENQASINKKGAEIFWGDIRTAEDWRQKLRYI